MAKILVSGSIAYDYIMNYDDNFSSAIDKEKIDNLSVGFLVNNLKKELGGTGLNIAYNLALLGENAVLLGAVGNDFIFDGILREKINLDYVYKSQNLLSASGYIINDKNGNQITAFYPGALDKADSISIDDVKEKLVYAIVSPNKKEAMLKHLKEAKQNNIKVFFDPGQQIGAFDKDDLQMAFKYSNYLIVNEYEFGELKIKSQKNQNELLEYFEKIIVTFGEKGSKIIDNSGVLKISAYTSFNFVDPTGAGDAYRAGLLKGLKLGLDWESSAQIGSVISSFCVSSHGGQNHFVDISNIEEIMKEYYKKNLELRA